MNEFDSEKKFMECLNSNGVQPQKNIVILVNGGPIWFLWCLDYIEKLVAQDENVIVLDFQNLVLKHLHRSLFPAIRRAYRVRNNKELIKKLKKSPKITYIKPKTKKCKKFLKMQFHETFLNSFKNGLDAEYFEEAGMRIDNPNILPKGLLFQAKWKFNLVCYSLNDILNSENVDKLIVPGGRTLIPMACISVGQALNVPCTVLESNDLGNMGYFEYAESFRRNNSWMQQEVSRKWLEADSAKYSVAKNFLENKLYRQDFKKEPHFASNFSTQFAAEQFKRNFVAFFPTSNFEFLIVPSEEKFGDSSRKDQLEKARAFFKIAKEYDFDCIVRGHPMRPGREDLSRIEDPSWINFCHELGVTYIASTDKLNSYELMKYSKLNAVYLSTVGIDSMILNCQTLILGSAEYAYLVPELCAFSENEIRNRFDSLVRHIPISAIYPFAYHMATLGKEPDNVVLSENGEIYYSGIELNPIRFKNLEKLRSKLKLIKPLITRVAG